MKEQITQSRDMTFSTKIRFAKVPHGIIDARIGDTLKLLLWLCYDRPSDWKFNVPEAARCLNKTPQCVRKYFRLMLDTGAFTKAGTIAVEHGIVPLYLFHPDKVSDVVKGNLKVNPETDPETDVETSPATNPESSRSDTKTNHTNTDHTENDHTKIDRNKASQPPAKTERAAPVKMDGEAMAEAFEKLFQAGSTKLV